MPVAVAVVLLGAAIAAGLTLAGRRTILHRVDQLQTTARKANAGGLGCGNGMITVITPHGPVKPSGESPPEWLKFAVPPSTQLTTRVP